MAFEPENPRREDSALRKVIPFTSVAMIIVALYVGWTFYSRSASNREAEEAASEKERQRAKKVTDTIYGSGEVRILNFSVDQRVVPRGKTANMCYGVSNATSVTLEPHVEDTKPSVSHCLQISPRKETKYTLTAKDEKGHAATASVTIQVQ